MRVMVFFDLPSVTHSELQIYRKFRKFLISEGFIMMQESVYSKLAMNGTTAKLICEKIRKNTPNVGIVQMLTLTEKQFADMEYVVGSKQTTIIDSEKRLIIL